MKDSAVKKDKLKAIKELILDCSGLYHLLYHDKAYASPGDEIKMDLELVNRSNANIQLVSAKLLPLNEDLSIKGSLENNQVKLEQFLVKIPNDFPFSNPYWLNETSANGLYEVEEQELIGKAENEPSINVEIGFIHKW